MEETDVVIVGAGPSGLALALALSRWQVKSILLEREDTITEDPRAIALALDVHRILRLLGVTTEAAQGFSQPVGSINIHRTTWTLPPYFQLDHEEDWANQVLPCGTVILQPKLEQCMRDLVQASPFAELRTRCQVIERLEEADGVHVTYLLDEGIRRSVKGRFLIGADGKRGVVRKQFLEPFGIKQEVGVHDYSGTWIAANLRVSMPTPETHPSFPLWAHGYQPDDLWDLFWPAGFHFCNHPTRPVAAGRFGPKHERLWRMEYELPQAQVSTEPSQELEEQVRPHLTIPLTRLGIAAPGSALFPWDCVEIVRCRPATFVHKVVNRWSHNRTVLIGDAAHVFPPFGAQGIANGVRDGFGLAWRLHLLIHGKNRFTPTECENLLTAWSSERREGVNDASKMTMHNGDMMRIQSSFAELGLRMANTAMHYLPALRSLVHRTLISDAHGFTGARNGAFLAAAGGGGKVAQVWIESSTGSLTLSDSIFWESSGLLTLIVLEGPAENEDTDKILDVIDSSEASPLILSRQLSIMRVHGIANATDDAVERHSERVLEYTRSTIESINEKTMPLSQGYDPTAFEKRFAKGSKYALVRSDLIIFSQAATCPELSGQIRELCDMLS